MIGTLLNVKAVSSASIRLVMAASLFVGLGSVAQADFSASMGDAFGADQGSPSYFHRNQTDRRREDRGGHGEDRTGSGSGGGNSTPVSANIPEGQREIIAAQQGKRGLNFVEVKDVEIIKVLPADNSGSKHQKWVVRLANGTSLQAVYNVDICDEVPLLVGSKVSMGGQYIFMGGGGLIHWLHADPRKSRPDGYVDVGGKRFGAVTHPDR